MIPHGRPVKEEPEKYFCSRRTYEATQNSAMISFKLKKGSSFKIELTTHSATDGKFATVLVAIIFWIVLASLTHYQLSLQCNHTATKWPIYN